MLLTRWRYHCLAVVLVVVVVPLFVSTAALGDEVDYIRREYMENSKTMVEQTWICHPWWPLNDNPEITDHFVDHTPDRAPGLDMASSNPDVVASISGEVTTVGWNEGGYGNYVIVTTLIGPVQYTITYAHLKYKSQLSTGDHISQGSLIGTMGSTGRSTGNHLHFEVKREGVRIDPEVFLGGFTESFVSSTF